MTIPVIDFSEPNRSEPTISQSTNSASKLFERNLIELGFSQIKNYGIDQTLLEKVFAMSWQFFTGDTHTKHRCSYLSAIENYGYQGIKEESLDPAAPPDLKESFTMRNILDKPPAIDRWPSEEFKDTMQAFYKNALESSYTLMEELAKRLEVDRHFFVKVHNGENISLRLLYYPETHKTSIQQKQLGAGAHTDYGFLTLLFQKEISGLQVLGPQNQWLDIPPVDQATVINSGDLLERWTNGIYRSTLHRVQPPVTARLSIAFFLDPDSDTVITPLPSCTRNKPLCYETKTAGEHIQQKLKATHAKRLKQ